MKANKNKVFTFPIKLMEYGYNEQLVRPIMEPQTHFTLEFNYVLDGEADLVYQDGEDGEPHYIKMFPGNFVLMKPYLTHSINSDKSIKYFVLEFALENGDDDFLGFLKQSLYVNSFPVATELVRLWKDILFLKDTQKSIPDILYKFKCFNEEQPPYLYASRLEILVKQLFLAIIQCRFEEKSSKGHIIHIKRAMTYLQSNYEKDISVKDVAAYTSLSPTHIQRVFKETFGKSVMDKLNEIRIEKAARLLMDSNRSVKTISEMTGFNSVQSFEYNFKKINGKSPSEYKKSELSQIVRFGLFDEFNKP